MYPIQPCTWATKARDARRITAAEMKYMRKTARYTWTDILLLLLLLLSSLVTGLSFPVLLLNQW
jgi:hypothetical protein